VFLGFLPVFGGVFMCGCLTRWGSGELFFGYYVKGFSEGLYRRIFSNPNALFFTSPLLYS
jgi:hypothetical protein